MAKAINTQFDQTVEEDVILEQLDGQAPAVQTTLKNAENVYKSFLYLRKMYSNFPAKVTIMGMATVNYASDTAVTIPGATNTIVINNHSGANASITLNGGTYVLQPGEKETFPLIAPDPAAVPVVAGDALMLNGSVSYIFKNVQEY